jgi:hypothetical protein
MPSTSARVLKSSCIRGCAVEEWNLFYHIGSDAAMLIGVPVGGNCGAGW